VYARLLPLTVGLGLAACGAPSPRSLAAPATERNAPKSNVRRADYAGSAACAACHPSEYAAWQSSPMRRMTRSLAGAHVEAPFDGRTFTFKGDSAVLENHDGQRFVRLMSDGDERLYRVTKVIGGRYREDFVGALVDSNDPLGEARDEERVLPLSWLIWRREPRYKGYSVMVPERARLEPGLVWKRACIFCHNTTSQFSILYDDLYGKDAPSYQGSTSVELPDDKAFRYTINDAPNLRAALDAELAPLGSRGPLPADAHEALAHAALVTRDRFDEKHLIELGVGCEACHGGARAHVENPRSVRPSFALASDFMDVTAPDGSKPTRAEDVNRTCAKCHTVLFSRYPYTWEGRTRRAAPGGSTTNSGEGRDFLLGACSHALTCTTCHDPHALDRRDKLEALGTPAGNSVCTSCHREYASSEALRVHSHHPPDSTGAACVACHLPKKNMGLDYELVRYHRIGSPTDRERVEGDRPLECALCHVDRSVDQIVVTMERWWKKSYDRAALRRLYGADLRQNPLTMTLVAGKPHERAVAATVLSQAGRTDMLASIATILDDDYPLVRYFGKAALERLVGEPLPLDMSQSGKDTRAAAERWLAERAQRVGSRTTAP
jgi:predicted CXXCH cytochrome family protein